MTFEHPLLLLLMPLTLGPLLLRRRIDGAVRVALPPQALERWPSWRVRLLWLPRVLACLALGFSLLAAAGPHGQARRAPDPRLARDVVLALDASESMRAVDFALGGRPCSRQEAAVELAGRFIAARQGDRIGLVVFGGRAATQCPLTFDTDVARALLEYVEPEMLGKRTALGDGLALAVARMPRGGGLVLLSDGENTAGLASLTEAARAARERGVRVYAVGIGSSGLVPVPARMPSGRVRMQMKDYPLDEGALRGVAEETGGRYFRGADAGALEGSLAEIGRLEQRPAQALRTVPARGWQRLAAACAGFALTGLLAASSLFLRTAPPLS